MSRESEHAANDAVAARAYRAQTLLALQGDLSKELDLMDELVREHIKSYQVWCVSLPPFLPWSFDLLPLLLDPLALLTETKSMI